MVGKCALHKPWKTRSDVLKPNQLTPVIHTALPLASTILFLSTCSQSPPTDTLEVTELELLLIDELELLLMDELELLFTDELAIDELVATEELLLILDDELRTTELDELVLTELETMLDELELLIELELGRLELELGFMELEETLVTDELELTPLQILPVTVGFSAVAPPLVP